MSHDSNNSGAGGGGGISIDDAMEAMVIISLSQSVPIKPGLIS